MQYIAGNAASRIELALALGKAGERVRAIGGEDKIAGERRLGRDDVLRGLAERNDDVSAGLVACLVAFARDRPRRAAIRQLAAAETSTFRTAAVSTVRRTNAPNGPWSCSAASHTARSSSSESTLERARSAMLVRRPPRTSGDTKSERLACQLSRVRSALRQRSERTGPLLSAM